MYDTRIRRIIDPPLNWIARRLRPLPVTANQITVAALVFGLASAVAVAFGAFGPALVALAASRIADGLDGAVARQHGVTRLGGYLDIVFDFFFYGAIPLAFAIADPSRNALAAAVLLASFYANGATFLGFAAVAAEMRLTTDIQGRKSIYYFAGLAEGAETIAVFCLMMVFPAAFVWLAFLFAAVCFVSAGARVLAVNDMLRHLPPMPPVAGAPPAGPVSGPTSSSAD
ncbi:hypothetical protein DLJ53_00440 [Acuticoccus sediminis]|uniref:Phosphatidylglycerophosphate synthase n=1 Tax=Acuticoccus sediminis TaxID=2184697 RepID=A0A8B2P1N7_9HYPH|nr:CDP-alcohol phosphatidyltransferase family protein [Acuticoccus sediminis]RAI03042.1 hypothetical protein DLJ53_00440 [Acuticoccus sediminis]